MYTKYLETTDEIITTNTKGDMNAFKKEDNTLEMLKKENLIEKMTIQKNTLNDEVKRLETKRTTLKNQLNLDYVKNSFLESDGYKDFRKILFKGPIAVAALAIVLSSVVMPFDIYLCIKFALVMGGLFLGFNVTCLTVAAIVTQITHKISLPKVVKELEEITPIIVAKISEIEYLDERINNEIETLNSENIEPNNEKIHYLEQKKELEALKNELNKRYKNSYNEFMKLVLIKK